MRAVICTRYGPPEVLRLAEVERPTPRRNQICIQIFATVVTVSDCIMTGASGPKRFVHSKYLFRKPQPEEYLQRLTQALLHTPTNLAIAIWVGYFTSDYRRALARIDKPALIIVAAQGLCGSGDTVCEDMQRRIRDSRLEVLENVDHALFVDDPNGSIRCSRVS